MPAYAYQSAIDPTVFDAIFNTCTDEMMAKRAYRQAAAMCHPDVCRDTWAHDMFLALQEAYGLCVARLTGKTTNEKRRAANDDAYAKAREKARQEQAQREAEAAAKKAAEEHARRSAGAKKAAETRRAKAAADKARQASEAADKARKIREHYDYASGQVAAQNLRKAGWTFSTVRMDIHGRLVVMAHNTVSFDWHYYSHTQSTWVICDSKPVMA